MLNHHFELDARGMKCPLPIVRAGKRLTKLNTGDVLKVISTDKGSLGDFDAFCKQTGNQLLESSQNENDYEFLIQKV